MATLTRIGTSGRLLNDGVMGRNSSQTTGAVTRKVEVVSGHPITLGGLTERDRCAANSQLLGTLGRSTDALSMMTSARGSYIIQSTDGFCSASTREVGVSADPPAPRLGYCPRHYSTLLSKNFLRVPKNEPRV